MLVLTRKIGQAFTVGDDIRVVVVGIERGQVQLGIEAPPSVGVRRSELTGPGKRSPAPKNPPARGGG
ncbi:MAG: carbon storage regulator [Candidatus Eremiobacteraeota bacterium]|nr:carbon storage regulator [Candidatus Eremiobacteraeota bacterium]